MSRTGLSSLAITSSPEWTGSEVCVCGESDKAPRFKILSFSVAVFWGKRSVQTDRCSLYLVKMCEKYKVGCSLFGDITSRISVFAVFSFGGCFGS